MNRLSQWGTGSTGRNGSITPLRNQKGNKMKLKILGLAILACAATSAFAVTNASGTADGHFEHHGATNNAVITAHDGSQTEHKLEFTRLKANSHDIDTSAAAITCTTSEYQGQVATKTVTTIELFPKYSGCYTTGAAHGSVVVHTNKCSYTFSAQGAREHGTVNVDCNHGGAIEITHQNCTIKVPAQTTAATLTEGISYTEKDENGKKILTADVTVTTITGHYESGICIFLGTSQKFRMEGSVTVRGYEYKKGSATDQTLEEGAQISITSK